MRTITAAFTTPSPSETEESLRLQIDYVLTECLLLALRARASTRAVNKSPCIKPVSLLLAVKNGEKFLAAKLESILALDYPRDQMEILVLSDGSTDRTNQIATSFAPQGVILITVPPGGKALANTHSPFYVPTPGPTLRTGVLTMSMAILELLAEKKTQ